MTEVMPVVRQFLHDELEETLSQAAEKLRVVVIDLPLFRICRGCICSAAAILGRRNWRCYVQQLGHWEEISRKVLDK